MVAKMYVPHRGKLLTAVQQILSKADDLICDRNDRIKIWR